MNVDALKNKDCPVCEKHEYTLLESQQERTIEDLCGNAYLFRFPPKALNTLPISWEYGEIYFLCQINSISNL